MRLEGVGLPQALAQDLVVVDFAVDGEGEGLVFAQHRLRARVHADDGEAFVNENRVVGCVVAAPVGAAVAYLSAHADGG